MYKFINFNDWILKWFGIWINFDFESIWILSKDLVLYKFGHFSDWNQFEFLIKIWISYKFSNFNDWILNNWISNQFEFWIILALHLEGSAAISIRNQRRCQTERDQVERVLEIHHLHAQIHEDPLRHQSLLLDVACLLLSLLHRLCRRGRLRRRPQGNHNKHRRR